MSRPYKIIKYRESHMYAANGIVYLINKIRFG